MNVIELNDVKLVGIDDLPENATLAQRLAFRTALVSTAQAIAQDLRTIGAVQADAKLAKQGTNREGRSGWMVRTFLTAMLGGEENTLAATLGKGAKESEAPGQWSMWQGVKQHASAATFLVQFLARNKVDLPKDAKETFVVAGNSVPAITADLLRGMTKPGASDTGIGTIIKYARAQAKKAEALAGAEHEAEALAVAAFFEENRAQMLALGVVGATIREAVTAPGYKGPSMDDIVLQGSAILERRKAEDAKAAEQGDRAAFFDRAVAFVGRDATDEELDRLIVALQDRKASMAAAAIEAPAPVASSVDKKSRKVA